MANFTVYLSPIEPTTIESKTVSSAFTQEDGMITIPMLQSNAGNSNINIELFVRKQSDNYILALFDPGSPYVSWERTYISFTNSSNVSPQSSITISFKNPGNDREAFPYWTSTLVSAKNPDKILEHYPFIIEKSWSSEITLGEIPESSSDIWNKSYEIEQEHIETQPIVRPGEYISLKWSMYVNGKSFVSPFMIIPYETPLFTGGWIRSKTGEGVGVKYSVEVYGSIIDGIMPTDFYDYQVGKWVYLMKNVNLTLDENKNFKQMYNSGNITQPNSTLGELEADVDAATKRDLAAKDAVINPIPPNQSQIDTAGSMSAAIAAIAAAAIVEAAAASAALIAAETALENYDPTEEVNTEYRIVPFNFKGPMNTECAVPYEDAIDLDSATNFEEVFDMIKYDATISNIDYDLDTATITTPSGEVKNNIPVFYYCDGSVADVAGGAGAFTDGDQVIVQIPNNDWNQAKIIGFLDGVKECNYTFLLRPKFNGHYAVKGDQPLKIEYSFEDEEVIKSYSVWGENNYPPQGDSDFYGYVLVTIKEGAQEFLRGNLDVPVFLKSRFSSYSYLENKGIGEEVQIDGMTFMAYYEADETDYDEEIYGYYGTFYYVKRVLWRPASTYINPIPTTTKTYEGVEYPVHEVAFTDLKMQRREPNTEARNNTRPFFNTSTCEQTTRVWWEDYTDSSLGVKIYGALAAETLYLKNTQYEYDDFRYAVPACRFYSPLDYTRCGRSVVDRYCYPFIYSYAIADSGPVAYSVTRPYLLKHRCIIAEDEYGNNPDFISNTETQETEFTSGGTACDENWENCDEYYITSQTSNWEWTYEMIDTPVEAW